jgi:hypothetical protein
VETFEGVKQVLQTCKPKAGVLENVESIDDAADDMPWDTLPSVKSFEVLMHHSASIVVLCIPGVL